MVALLHTPPASAATAPQNPDFETGDLTGWTVVRGDTFMASNATTYWGGTFNQHRDDFLSGYIAHGDDATGEIRSSTFPLSSDAVSFLIGGGWNPGKRWSAPPTTRSCSGRPGWMTRHSSVSRGTPGPGAARTPTSASATTRRAGGVMSTPTTSAPRTPPRTTTGSPSTGSARRTSPRPQIRAARTTPRTRCGPSSTSRRTRVGSTTRTG
jgi:hypothetical protein